VLGFSEIETIFRLCQKSVGRFFENNYFNPHYGYTG
jgi:hypothetical protein